MVNDHEWLASIDSCGRDFQVTAQSYRGIAFHSYSAPIVLGCDDGQDYVVKIPRTPGLFRAICNDQVMGHVAARLMAPVPEVRIVNIPQALIDGQPELAGMPAGPAHGSRYLPNVNSTRRGIAHANIPTNRPRFSILATMYGLAGVFIDHQFFYEDVSNHVWSFDHGHFFHGGPNWTIATLISSPAATPDPVIVDGCMLTDNEIKYGLMRLAGLSNESICHAVSAPDHGWGLSAEERVALAKHLSGRRDDLYP